MKCLIFFLISLLFTLNTWGANEYPKNFEDINIVSKTFPSFSNFPQPFLLQKFRATYWQPSQEKLEELEDQLKLIDLENSYKAQKDGDYTPEGSFMDIFFLCKTPSSKISIRSNLENEPTPLFTLVLTEMLKNSGHESSQFLITLLSRSSFGEVQDWQRVIHKFYSNHSDFFSSYFQIKRLHIFDTNLKDASPLYLPASITHWYMVSSRLTNFSYLKVMENLTSLTIKSGLTKFKIDSAPCLKNLTLSSNSLTAVEIRSSPNLKTLELSHNLLENIYLPPDAPLESLNINNNKIQILYLPRMETLKTLQIVENPLQILDLSNAIGLEHLYATTSQIQNINVSAQSLNSLITLCLDGVTLLKTNKPNENSCWAYRDNQEESWNFSNIPSLDESRRKTLLPSTMDYF